MTEERKVSVNQDIIVLHSFPGCLVSLTYIPWKHPTWHRFELEEHHGCATSTHLEVMYSPLTYAQGYPSLTVSATPPLESSHPLDLSREGRMY